MFEGIKAYTSRYKKIICKTPNNLVFLKMSKYNSDHFISWGHLKKESKRKIYLITFLK